MEELIPRTALEAEPWPAYVVGRDGRIVHVNAAWDRAAADDGGPLGSEAVGSLWIDHVHGAELVAWCEEVLGRVLGGDMGEGYLGDCNTPRRRRLFFSRFEPLRRRGAREPGAMLVVTSLIAAGPIEERYQVAPPDDRRYLQSTKLILQCGGCRRVHVAGTSPRVWEFVPAYVEHLRADISHGLCELCREVHYGQHLRLL